MKLSDYKRETLKSKMASEIDTQHDTVFGAFVKGVMETTEMQWISEKNPEDFDDIKFHDESFSDPFAVRLEGSKEGEVMFGIAVREKSGKEYSWNVLTHTDYNEDPSVHGEIKAWKEIYV